MNLDWLTHDAFIQKELAKFILSLFTALSLLWIGRVILSARDRRIQELDRNRHLLDEVRNEFVQIFNEYYKVRKRYAIIREVLAGDASRNPYIGQIPGRDKEALDELLVTCIALEAQYYTLMERLKISFPDLWKSKLKILMERKSRDKETKEKNDDTIEFYFDRIRDHIEQEKVIDRAIKNPLAEKFRETMERFSKYEVELLAYPKAKRKEA